MSPRATLPIQPLRPRRLFSLASVSPILLAPAVFTGLTLTLWTYKCVMMVLFQSRIIYMPGIPLGSRKETIESYRSLCQGVEWTEERRLRTTDGKVLAAVSATVSGRGNSIIGNTEDHVVIVYFQGYGCAFHRNLIMNVAYCLTGARRNAASAPPRLPYLSTVLTAAAVTAASTTKYTLYYPSYRGYWTSTGRPSQRGIERDLAAIFAHLGDRFPHARIVLWGQSIGCGILLEGLATHHHHLLANDGGGGGGGVHALILETPFTSIADMLVALYPQRWLPYRYLGGLLWNRWDAVAALKSLGLVRSSTGTATGIRRVLVLRAERDELVPVEVSRRLVCAVESELAAGGIGSGVDVETVVVRAALHTECLAREQGRGAVARLLRAVSSDGDGSGGGSM